MSSIPNPATQPQAPVDITSAVRQTTDEVRQSLHQHLRKTASFIKFMDALVLLFSWMAGITLIWLIACGVDHWLWPLASWGRWLFWSLGMAGSLWFLGWQLLPLIVRKINPVYAAKRIEHLVPEFKNGLISWLELEAIPEHGVPRGVMSALAYRAARFIGGQDPSATVDTSPLIKIIGCVLLLSTGLVIYTMLSPKSAFVTGYRILFPWSSTAAPTRVQILEIKPGAMELTQGKPLEVEVAVKGLRRDEQVTVRVSTLDGQIQNQRTSLSATTAGFRYAGSVATDGQGVEQPLDYWIEAGDAVRGPFRISLSPLPSVVLQSIELQYPPYTQLQPHTITGEKLEAVEGTRVTFRAQSNQPLSRGRMEVNPTLDESGGLVRAQAFIDMEIDQRQLTAPMTLQLDSAKTNPTKVEYRIRGYNQRGDANPRPITHTLNVLADVPPEVTLLGPENRLLRVRANSRINLEVRASDPDFGLSRLLLKPSRNGVAAADIVLLEAEAARGRQVKTYSIDLTGTRASVGEQFELVAVAEDNRHDPISQQIAPNVTRSLPLVLKVVGPDETPDVPPSSPNDQLNNSPDGPTDKQPPTDNPQQSPANPSGNRTNQPAGQQPPENGSQSPSNSGQDSAQSKQPADNPPPGKQQQEGQSGGSGSSGGSSAQSSSQGEQQESGQGQSSNGSGSSGSSSPANPSQSSKSNQSGNNQSGENQSGKNSTSSDSRSNNSSDSQSNSNDSSATDTNAGDSSATSGGKPSNDGEAIKRVSEFLESQQDQSGSDASKPKPASNNQPENGQQAQQDASNSSPPQDPQTSTPQSNSGQTPNSQPDGAPQPNNSSGTDAKPDNSPTSDTPSSNPQSQGTDSKASPTKGEESSNPSPSPGSDPQSSKPNQSQSPNSQPQNPQSQNQGSQGTQDKGSDSKGSDSKGSDSTGSDSTGSDSKGSDSKGSDSKGSDSKGSDSKGSDSKGSDSKGSDSKGSDSKGSDSKGSDSKGSDSKGSDSKGSDSKGSDSKGSDSKGSDSKGSDSKGSDSKGSDSKGSDSKGSDSKGSDSKGSDSKGADSKGADSKGSDSKGSPSQGSQSESAKASGGASEGSPSSSGSGNSSSPPNGSGTGTRGGTGGSTGQRDETNVEFANRTTQMVLDYLNRQKDQPDPELLRELDWTKQDLQQFVERWNQARNLAESADPAQRRKWQEMLEDLNLTSAQQRVRQGSGRNDSFQQQRDAGGRLRMPAALQKQFDAFRKALEQAR